MAIAGKAIIIILAILLFSSDLVAQQNRDKAKTVSSLFQMLETYHYDPPTRNSTLSNHIFEHLIKTLDPYALFFTDETIACFIPYRDSLCTNNADQSSDFVTFLTAKYRERILVADSIVDQCFYSSLNFSEIDSMILDTENVAIRSKNNLDIEVRWKKWIKYRMLRGLIFSGSDNIQNHGKVIPDSLYAAKSLLAKKTRIREKRRLNQLLNCQGGMEDFVMNSYLNSITSCYDPHSNYFSDNDKVRFESSLSKENYAFGFELGNNLNDEVIISDILPDSPLWHSKKLEKGDVILKIKIPGQEETDLAFATRGEIDNLFNTLEGDLIEMTIRKLNGSILTVELIKGNFDTKENQTVGYILKGEKPIGYIWFSTFYTEFNRYGNVGCSIDILREIVKLKESGIEGLIIDLRNNPGGSEGEAMEIAAYFTGNGPFVVRTNKGGIQNVLGKENAIKWYDDPVVVLVNSKSASGSELLAAILQDYNRAIIIGSNTFGKATEQYVFPLAKKMASPNPYRSRSVDENFGFVKVTSGKLFRVTGKSYQKAGITPDILLPDIYRNLALKELDLPFALEKDSINALAKFTPLTALPVDQLSKLSKNRMIKDEKFGPVSKLNHSLKTLTTDKRKVTLNLTQYKNDAEKIKQLMSEFDSISISGNKQFIVENTSFKLKKIQTDSLTTEMDNKFKATVSKDIYVGEAFSVVLDLIGLKSIDQINK